MMFAICNIHEDHNSKNQFKTIIEIINKHSLKKKLYYFIINNVSFNNWYIAMIIDLILPNYDLKEQKF